MKIMKILLLMVAALGWLFTSPGTAALDTTRAPAGFETAMAPDYRADRLVEHYWVKKDGTESSEETSADIPEKTGKANSQQPAEKKTEPNQKQLKPFVPSEEIPADQGVDFPYDI